MPELRLPGIAETSVPTSRLTQNVLHPVGVEPSGPAMRCCSCTAT